jgi:hypothetical protein
VLVLAEEAELEGQASGALRGLVCAASTGGCVNSAADAVPGRPRDAATTTVAIDTLNRP